MKKLIYFGFLLLFFSSCKKEYAYLQKSSEDSFLHKQKNEPISVVELDQQAIVASTDDSPLLTDFTPIYRFEDYEVASDNEVVGNNQVVQKENPKNKKKNKKKKVEEKKSWQKTLFPNDDVKEKKPKKKSSGINFRRWNSMIPTGFLFLGIAILLAVFNVPTLPVLFGIAAIVFLFLGLKRFFRKRKRQNLFR